MAAAQTSQEAGAPKKGIASLAMQGYPCAALGVGFEERHFLDNWSTGESKTQFERQRYGDQMAGCDALGRSGNGAGACSPHTTSNL